MARGAAKGRQYRQQPVTSRGMERKHSKMIGHYLPGGSLARSHV